MKLKTLGPRVDLVTHPVYPEVKAKILVPDQVGLAEINLRLDPFRERTYLKDEKGKYFRDKRERPFYEIQLDLRKATPEIMKILDECLQELEGLDLDVGIQDAPKSKIVGAPELEYKKLEPIEEDGGHDWKDEDGDTIYVRWDDEKNKPVMRTVTHNWGVDLFWRILTPPTYKESDEGKDLPTPTI